jgi:hypothetical protein
MSPAGRARVAGSDNQVIAETPDHVYSVTPMTDGTFVASQLHLGPAGLYSSSGQLLGTAEPLSTCLTDLTCGVAYVTPDGGVTVLGTDRVSYSNRSQYSQHWVKVAPTYTPGMAFGGEAGVASAFATRPGAITNTEVPTAPEVNNNDTPQIVTGSGSGASFGGIAGCETAACLDLVNSSTRIIDAIRASQRLNKPSSKDIGFPEQSPIVNQSVEEIMAERQRQFRAGVFDEELAADAVMALAKAARKPVPDWETAMGVSNMLRDNGEMLRLVAGGKGFLDGTPEQRYEQVQAWIDREQNLQKMEVDSGNAIQDITIANIGANIRDPLVFKEYVDNFITPLMQGLPVQFEGN